MLEKIEEVRKGGKGIITPRSMQRKEVKEAQSVALQCQPLVLREGESSLTLAQSAAQAKASSPVDAQALEILQKQQERVEL